MIMLGGPDDSPDGALHKASEEELAIMLRNPSHEVRKAVRHLRLHMNEDFARQRPLLKQLPFAVCGIFSPPSVMKENFAYADRFIVWIRFCASMGIEPEELRKRVLDDREVMMCFSTPRADGLILIFALSRRCHDAGLYSVFCRKFARDFAVRHGIKHGVQTAYADISRICLIGADRQAYCRLDAAKVNISDYIDTGNPEEALGIKRREDRRDRDERKSAPPEPKMPADPDTDVLDAIRKKLGSRVRARPAGPAADPGKLESVQEELRKHIVDNGIEVTEIVNFRGALKIRASLKGRHAEVNVFPGKQGFTTLFAPLGGTDIALSRILADMVRNFLANM